jgi:hypothetical protein
MIAEVFPAVAIIVFVDVKSLIVGDSQSSGSSGQRKDRSNSDNINTASVSDDVARARPSTARLKIRSSAALGGTGVSSGAVTAPKGSSPAGDVESLATVAVEASSVSSKENGDEDDRSKTGEESSSKSRGTGSGSGEDSSSPSASPSSGSSGSTSGQSGSKSGGDSGSTSLHYY